MEKYLFLLTKSNGANGICVKRIMEKLLERKCDVYCITNREYSEKKEFIEDGVKFYTVTPRFSYKILSYIKYTKNNKLYRKILKLIFYILNKISLILSLPNWPLISYFYCNRIYYHAKKICRENNIDYIIPVYSQIDTVIAAYKIKKYNLKNIKYVPYFLDSLSGGYGPKYFSENWTIHRGLKWEKKLLPLADKIIMMKSSEIHHKKYSLNKSYYDKMIFLDIPLFQPDLKNKVENNVDNRKNVMNHSMINIVYAGSLPKGIRSPEFFLKIFEKIKNQNIHVYFIGSNDCKVLNDFVKKDHRIHVIDSCAHEIVLQYELEATVLLNIGNTNTNMTPSKIFEYMSFGKPIISTMPIKDEPSSIYLQRYPLTFFLKEYEDNENIGDPEITEELENFLIDLPYQKVDMDYLQNEFKLNLPSTFIDTIRGEG